MLPIICFIDLVGSETLLFRMRLGTVVPGAKGYSVLFDTGGKFGATVPNADQII